jgi:hypothetical protein
MTLRSGRAELVEQHSDSRQPIRQNRTATLKAFRRGFGGALGGEGKDLKRQPRPS